MGCVPLHKQVLSPMKAQKSVNGLLKVTIEQAYIKRPRSKLFDMDPYLKLRMSNQQFQGYIHKKAGREPFFNESFEFIVNSCYKQSGRSIDIQLWDECKLNDKMIGLGIIDLDPIINFNQIGMLSSSFLMKSQNEQQSIKESKVALRKNLCKLKVFLNHNMNEAGYVNAKFQFFQQPVQVVRFRFIFANIRRKSSLFTTMHCWVQVIAGQEVLCTQKKKDKDTKDPPSWQEQMLTFNIPRSLRHVLIRVMDDSDQLGRITLPLLQIIDRKCQHHFQEQIQTGHNVTGILKFTVSVGLPSLIAEMKRQERVETQKTNQLQQQIPQQKETKMQESYAKTTYYTHGNEQQHQKQKTQTIENSKIIFQNNEPL